MCGSADEIRQICCQTRPPKEISRYIFTALIELVDLPQTGSGHCCCRPTPALMEVLKYLKIQNSLTTLHQLVCTSLFLLKDSNNECQVLFQFFIIADATYSVRNICVRIIVCCNNFSMVSS